MRLYIWNGYRWVHHPTNVIVPAGALILVVTVSLA